MKLSLKPSLLAPPVLLGVAVLAWQITGKEPPDHGLAQEVARSVRVIEVKPVTFVPRAIGFGFVEPGTVWDGVPQVEGQVVYRHPELERGQILEAGTELLRIDPTDYELAVARAEANLASSQAQLEELAVERSNLEKSIEIERRALQLQQRELERQESLVAKGTASRAKVDQAETTLLTQRQRLLDLENQLRLLPTRGGVLQASVKLNETALKEAEVNLERTVIRLPFTARIAETSAEQTQFVRSGETLVVADSIDQAEVSVQVPLDRMRPLVPPGIELTNLTDAELSRAAQRLGLSARLRLPIAGFTGTWEGRFDRVSDTVDPRTRSLGVIVVVDQPYRQAVTGELPPLTKNMFVQVELSGQPRPERLVIPRVALHETVGTGFSVYLIGEDNRLKRQAVVPSVLQGDLVVIAQGLDAGALVVVSDLVPAVEGMLLSPTPDVELAARLTALAEAAEPLE